MINYRYGQTDPNYKKAMLLKGQKINCIFIIKGRNFKQYNLPKKSFILNNATI